MKMVLTLSPAWLLPVLACVCVVNFEFTLADVKGCSIARNGTLTMFNGETAEVKLPCKYRLSDFTCGDYRVKVTPGSAVDRDYSHRFSPVTVWVKVVNTKTEDYLKIRTSVKRLDKFSKGKISNPWKVKEGSKRMVDFADYDQTQAAAVLRKDGVFSVEFSSAEQSVVVSCSDDKFVSLGLPEALCGDGTTTDVMHKAITNLFPGQDDVTDDALVAYVVLNHDNVVQSPTCKDLASKFTSCQDKERAAMECVDIFGDQAECLARSDTSLRDYYADCLTSVCDDVTSALEPMNNYTRHHCVSTANCVDSLKFNPRSGIRTFYVSGKPITVYCDQTTDNGGWIVFQRRIDASTDFYRNWTEYRNGFGDLERNFWLGLDTLHWLTASQKYELRVDLRKWDGTEGHATYSGFVVEGAVNNFALQFDTFTGGNAGDSLSYHRGQQFSTKDRDHDTISGERCTQHHHGAWWYQSCLLSNLNGDYKTSSSAPDEDGVSWKTFGGFDYSMKFTEMKIRPI